MVRLGEDWTEEEITEYKQKNPFEMGYVKIKTSAEAFANVLENAGATFPKRDAIDVRVCG
ncbi:hypothetical protein LCGC14_2271530, partial [marine sediment metagenome]